MNILYYFRRLETHKLEVASITACWLRSLIGAMAVLATDNLLHYARHNNWMPSEFIIGPLVTFFVLVNLHLYDRRLARVEKLRLEIIGDMSKRIKAALDGLITYFLQNGVRKDLEAANEASDKIIQVLNEALPAIVVPLHLFKVKENQNVIRHHLNNVVMILKNLHELPSELARQSALGRSICLITDTLELIN